MLWGIFFGIIAIGFIIVRSTTRDLVGVRVAVVDHQNIVSSVSTNGKVEPIDEFPAYASAPGVVAKVYVDVGQKVKAGQLLLKMDDADAVAKIATANAAVHAAEATLHDIDQGGSQDERIGFSGDLTRAEQQQQQAAKDLAALKALQQKGAASASEVASAEQRLLTAESSTKGLQTRTTQRYSTTDRARAEAQLGDARAALAAAQAAYANDNIRAPFAGTVYSIPVSNYDFVPAGENLLDMADPRRAGDRRSDRRLRHQPGQRDRDVACAGRQPRDRQEWHHLCLLNRLQRHHRDRSENAGPASDHLG